MAQWVTNSAIGPVRTALGFRRTVSILAYHGVADSGRFAAQLRTLREIATFISADDLRAALSGAALPEHPILVTFDDGERSVLDHGLPVVAELGIRPLLFVCGGLVDSRLPFWWEEVSALTGGQGDDEVRRLKVVPDTQRRAAIEALRAETTLTGTQLTTEELHRLVDAGFEIGNHTWDHPCLDQCSDTELERQIVDGHLALLERGITPTAFAYPNGNLDTRAEPILERLGYDLGFVFDHRHARLDKPPLRLSRLRIDASASPERARLIVSGLHGTLMRLRRRGGG